MGLKARAANFVKAGYLKCTDHHAPEHVTHGRVEFGQVGNPRPWVTGVNCDDASPAPRLIDVQGIAVRPETREFALSWLPNRPRRNIPGSLWLPNVGYAELEKATGGNFDRPMVFYCIADCWLSWNSLQRAHGYGYRNLYWYPHRTDGWEEAGLPLVEATPIPLDRALGAEDDP